MKTKDYNLSYIIPITLIATLGGLLFGYDTAVVSGAEKGLEGFFLGAKDFNYTASWGIISWHGFTVASALIGCVIGGLISGFFANKLGRRNSLRFASVLFFLSAVGSWYPFLGFSTHEPSFQLMIAFNLYRILGGIGVGMASAIVPMYIAEIAPSSIRGTLVSCNQFAIIFGMLVVYFVNFLIKGDAANPVVENGVVTNALDAHWMTVEGWRLMFGSEAYVAFIFGLLLFFVPKTPRYLVMIGQEAKAMDILTKVNGQTNAAIILEDIRATAKEKKEKLFAYGGLVIFIGIMLSVFQQAIGINAVLYYSPRMFEGVGADGMLSTVIMGIINIVFTVIAIVCVDKMGRKPLLIIGSIGMAIGAFAVALCDQFHIQGFVPVIAIMFYAAAFMMSWGPICWVLISEIFPNTIRGAAVAIAVAFQWIFNYLISCTFPSLWAISPMLAYGIYGIVCVLAAVFVWKMVPETKGKTLEDMSKLWRK